MPLIPSGPVSSSAVGQIIENLDITAASGTAVTITHNDVILRNCRIRHGGRGVFSSGDRTRIEGCEIFHTNPPSGQNPYSGPDNHINIRFDSAPDAVVLNCDLYDGSTGIYLTGSPGAHIEHCRGFNFRGDFPRGQFVQFNGSGNGLLTQFHCLCEPNNSHPEDNVSVYNSANTEVSWGVIDGNNSTTGDGVLVENNSTGVVVHHIDCIHQANGAYGTYASGTLFDVTRNFDHITFDQGRGPASSNYLMWNASAPQTRIRASTYTRGSNNVVWNKANIVELDLTEDPGAVAMTPIVNTYSWNAGGGGQTINGALFGDPDAFHSGQVSGGEVSDMISFVGGSTGVAPSNGSVSVPLPAGTSADDFVFLVIACDGVVTAPDNTPTTPGYTQLVSVGDGNPSYWTGWKRMGPTPDTSVTVEGGGATSGSTVVLGVFRGVDEVNPIAVTQAVASGASGIPNPPALTLGVDQMSIAWGVTEDDVVSNVNAPASWADLVWWHNGTVNACQTAMLASRLITVAGSYDPGTFATGVDDNWRAGHVSLKKATSAPPAQFITGSLFVDAPC